MSWMVPLGEEPEVAAAGHEVHPSAGGLSYAEGAGKSVALPDRLVSGDAGLDGEPERFGVGCEVGVALPKDGLNAGTAVGDDDVDELVDGSGDYLHPAASLCSVDENVVGDFVESPFDREQRTFAEHRDFGEDIENEIDFAVESLVVDVGGERRERGSAGGCRWVLSGERCSPARGREVQVHQRALRVHEADEAVAFGVVGDEREYGHHAGWAKNSGPVRSISTGSSLSVSAVLS